MKEFQLSLYDARDDRFKVLADLRRGTHLLKALGYQGWQRGALLATWEPLQKSSDKPSVFRSAAFLGTDGVTYETGSHHDIELLPPGIEVSAEGFVDREGRFHTRDEAAKVMCLDHALHSEEVELKKSEPETIEWLHGTSGTALREAVKEGQLRPGNVNSKSRGWTTPLANRVYLTRSPEVAVKYANWKSKEVHRSPEMGVAVVKPDPTKLVPDEDWLGALALHGMAQHRTGYSSMPPKHPLWPRLMAALHGHPVHQAIEGTSDYDADRTIHHARIGKRIIPVLRQRDPGLLKELTDIAPSVAHEGPLPIVSAHVAPVGSLDAKDWRAGAQPLEVGVRKSEVELKKGEGQKASNRDLRDAVEYVRVVHGHDVRRPVHAETVELEPADIVSNFMFGNHHLVHTKVDAKAGTIDGENPGWLKSYPPEDWAGELKRRHGREFSHIVEPYRMHGKISPAVMVGNNVGDGLGRAIFSHAVGAKLPVAIYDEDGVQKSESEAQINGEKSFSQDADDFLADKSGITQRLNADEIQGRLRDHRETLEAMATTSGQHPAFQVAAKMAGHPADAELRRQAELDYGDDLIAVALAAHGLNPDDESLRMSVEAACLAMRLQKSEFNVSVLPRMVTAGQLGAEHMVTVIRRCFASNLVYEVRLGGKHSAGTAVAYDQQADRFWLLKPGSARVSPAAGVDQTNYSQSRREAAFAQAVRVYEPMRQFYPETWLLLLDGHEVACLEVMGQGFRSAQRYGDAAELLKGYQDTLDIYRWAFWDWVLGNPDGHGGNLLVTEDGRVALIDHGSALAGPAFNPPMDKKSFIPYYLRVFRAIDYKKATPEQRYNGFPHPTPDERDALKAWMQALGDSWAAPLEELTPGALAACQQRFDAIVNADDPVDELLRRWAGLPAAKT